MTDENIALENIDVATGPVEIVGTTPAPKTVRRSVLVGVKTHARLKLATLNAEVESGEKVTMEDMIVRLLDHAGK